jgi:general stress protein YciG
MKEEVFMAQQGTSNRGFASMDRARQREIASLGGKAAHAKGTAHEFTPEEAREAGRKGGQASGGRRAEAARLREAQRNAQAAGRSESKTEHAKAS